MAAADARLEEERAARRAPMEVSTKLTAGLVVSASRQAASTNAPEVPQTPVVVASGGPTPYPVQGAVVGGVVPQVAYTPGEIYRDLNDQKTKLEFSVSKAESVASNVAKPADPELLPYTIFAGTIIPAALQTGINTDLPGDVLATVTENVYDSVSGKNLLIPQGSKLLAKYSSAISFGQNRVQVAWQRLIRPDGVSLQMGNMNGVDPQGASGYAGSVDEHWWDYAKGIGLMLLFSVIDGQIQYSMKEANTQGATDVANSLTAALDQVGSQYTSNVMNIQPTITVKQGSKVQVFVNPTLSCPLRIKKRSRRNIQFQKRKEALSEKGKISSGGAGGDALGVLSVYTYKHIANHKRHGGAGLSYGRTRGTGDGKRHNRPAQRGRQCKLVDKGRLLRRRVWNEPGGSDHRKAPGLHDPHCDDWRQIFRCAV